MPDYRVKFIDGSETIVHAKDAAEARRLGRRYVTERFREQTGRSLPSGRKLVPASYVKSANVD